MLNNKFSLLFILFLSIFTNAQTPEASLNINVKNQLGEVIPDAEITISNTAREEKTVKTNKQGIAQFSKLAEGEYQLTIKAIGFSDYKNERIILVKGEINKIEIVLEVAAFESSVAVGGDQDVDTDSFGTTKVIDESQIQKLPDNPEELERVLRAMAGESVTGEQMPITVDGAAGGKIPPKEAIQQIRVNQNVFSAQYEGPNGGGIEIFTRSSANKFRGYAGYNFADSRFDAADPYLGKRIPSQSRNFFTNFSGPITKNSSFFFYYSRNENDSSTSINAITLNSALQPIEFKETFSTPTRGNTFGLNFNIDLTKKHKISYSSYSSFNKSQGQNVGGFSLPSRANNGESQYHNIRLSETYLVNENIVNQSRFWVNYFINKSFGGSNEAAINVLEAFFGGGSQNNSSNKNLTFELANETTWQILKYGLGFGWKIKGQQINQTSTSNFGGTYTFSGRTAPLLDGNNNPVLDTNGNVINTQINSLESYRRTLLLTQLGYSTAQIRALGGGANQFTISGGNPEVEVNQYDFGLYQQNSYKVNETLAVSFGLRYENQTNINSDLNFSPRFGVIWSPKSNPKKSTLFALPRISMGYGIFYRRFDVNNFLSIRQTNDADRSQYLITASNILDLFPTVPSISLLEQFALPKSSRFIEAEIQTPQQKMLSISASKKLPFGFSLSSNFSYSKLERQAFTQNINAPLAGTFDPQNPNSGLRPLGNTGNVYKTFSNARGENLRTSVTLNLPEKYLYGSISYSFTKARNNIVSGSGSPNDAYDFSQEYAPTFNDGVHSLSSYFFYQLPYKFTFSGDFSLSSGSRFNITTGRDTNGDGFFNERPSFATDLTKPNLVQTEYGILDPNPSPTDSLIPRNFGRGNKIFNFNSGLSKSFGFGEDKANKKPAKQTIHLSIRVNNLFNIVNRGNPIGNMSSPNFLKTLSGASSDSIIFINGIQANTGAGRSFSFNVGFSF